MFINVSLFHWYSFYLIIYNMSVVLLHLSVSYLFLDYTWCVFIHCSLSAFKSHTSIPFSFISLLKLCKWAFHFGKPQPEIWKSQAAYYERKGCEPLHSLEYKEFQSELFLTYKYSICLLVPLAKERNCLSVSWLLTVSMNHNMLTDVTFKYSILITAISTILLFLSLRH